MQTKTTPRRATGLRHSAGQYLSWAVAGAAGALCFALVLASVPSLLTSAVSQRGRVMIVQDGPMQEGGYGTNMPMMQQGPDMQRQVKDAERQLKEMENNMRGLKALKGTPEYAELDDLLQEYKGGLSSVKAQYASIDKSDAEALQDIQSAFPSSQVFYDYMQDKELNVRVEEQRRLKDAKRMLKEKTREVKKMTNECKRTKCQGSDAEQFLNDFKQAVEAMKQAMDAKDVDALEDAMMAADSQNFWDAIQLLYVKKDLEGAARRVKDIDRMLKEAQKAAKSKKIDASTLAEIEDVAAMYKASLKAARSLYDEGDAEGARGELEEAIDAQRGLDELFEPLRRGGGEGSLNPQELEKILLDIGDAEKSISDAMTKGTTSKEVAGFCRDLLGRGRDIVKQLQQAFQKGDEGPIENLGEKLQQIGDEVDQPCAQFMPEE